MNARDVIGAFIAQTAEEDFIISADADTIADAILSALTAAGLVVEQGWQPIATAPMGVRVHGWTERGTIVEGEWFDGAIYMKDVPGALIDGATGRLWPCLYWRPLLAPPAAQEPSQ